MRRVSPVGGPSGPTVTSQDAARRKTGYTLEQAADILRRLAKDRPRPSLRTPLPSRSSA